MTDYSTLPIDDAWDVPQDAEPVDVEVLVNRQDIDINIRFDLARALYWHCVGWYDGMSERYTIQCRLGYKPGMSEREPNPDQPDEDEATLYIYQLLERNVR